MKILPTTKDGMRSAAFFLAFSAFLIIFQILVLSGQRGGETFFSNPYLTIPFLTSALFALLMTFSGLKAIIKQKERAIMVFITLFVGITVTLFLLAELIFPH